MNKSGTLHKPFTKLLGLVGLSLCAAQALATPMYDSYVSVSAANGARSLIDVDNKSVSFYCYEAPCEEDKNAGITNGTGIFEPIKYQAAKMYDFQIGDANGANYLEGHTLWSSGTYSMRVDKLVDSSLDLGVVTGIGKGSFFNGDELLATGDWKLTLSQTGAIGNFESTAAVPVPEPGAMVLLGLGLAGIGATRRRAAARQS